MLTLDPNRKNKINPYPFTNPIKQTDQLQNQIVGYNLFINKPFYCGQNRILHKDSCCFNHIVGLPENEKSGQVQPLFDYEAEIYQALKSHKYIWIKKATGLGISEFFLRYMLWLCVRNNDYQYNQMCIVVGPNIDLAMKLIKRMKNIIGHDYLQQSSNISLTVNNVDIQAYPSHHLDAYRSLTSPKFILLDETDFFTPGQQDDVRDVTERYIAKSQPYIVMVSTPNRPDGLFAKMEKEPNSMYHKLYFDYTRGLNKIYTEAEIAEAKASPGFEREYNLKYLGKIGNVFSPSVVDRAIVLGNTYQHLPINQYCIHFGSLDPGFSKITPLYVGELDTENDIFRIIYFEQFDNTTTPEIVANRMHQISTQYVNLWWLVDGSNRGLINQLKTKFGESVLWDKPEDVSTQNSKIIPINFTKEHKQMLEHCHLLVSSGKVAIPDKYDRLITALRTAQATEWNLSKEETVNDDDLDELRMMLKLVKFGSKT